MQTELWGIIIGAVLCNTMASKKTCDCLGGRSCIKVSMDRVYSQNCRLIKICLNEMYTKIWIGLHLSDTFPIQDSPEQDVFSTILFSNFALECAIQKV